MAALKKQENEVKKNRCIRLSDDEYSNLKKIGDGVVTIGIRKLIDFFYKNNSKST